MASNNQKLISALRWKWHALLDKTGQWPLISFSIPLVVAIYWGAVLLPQICQIQVSLHDMQLQLRSPLPLQVDNEHVLDVELSVTEYQQLKIMFDLFEKYNLQIESGNYHFQPTDDQHTQVLILTVPLRGKWLSLTQALQDISRALPIELDQLHISRPTPETDMLSITLQLTLHRGQQ